MKPVKDNVQYIRVPFADTEGMCPLENWCFRFLGLHREISLFRKRQGSIQHYNVMYSYNGIDIALSTPERFSEQGLMLRFSGDGIAFYEKFRRNTDKNWTWVGFLKEFFSLACYGFTCRCTRIDLAFDDISHDDKYLIDMNIIERALNNGEYVSMFHYDAPDKPLGITDIRQKLKRKKGTVVGNTIYLGNRKSKVFVRFYDKLAESKAHKEPVDESIKHWIRMEFEFKDVRAMTVCDCLLTLSPEDFGQYIAKVTNGYIRFIVPKGDPAHYYRCSSKKWWKNVVGTVEKARLVENKAYRNRFNSSMHWLRRQVFPTLYAVLHCLRVDEFITDVRKCGLSAVQKNGSNTDLIIQDYFRDTVSECFKGLDVHKASTDEYEKILHDLEVCAFGSRMRKLGYTLCEASDLMSEYDKFHRTNIQGQYDKTIDSFKNDSQLDEPFPFFEFDEPIAVGEQSSIFTYGYMSSLDNEYDEIISF